MERLRFEGESLRGRCELDLTGLVGGCGLRGAGKESGLGVEERKRKEGKKPRHLLTILSCCSVVRSKSGSRIWGTHYSVGS